MAANEMSEKTRMIITIAVVVVVNAGLGYLLYTRRAEFQRLEAAHKVLLKKRDELKVFVAQKEEKTAELKRLTETNEKQLKQLPSNEEIADLVTQIAKIAKDSGVDQKNFGYVPGSVISGPGGVQVARATWKSKWEGGFMGWCQLMNHMEENLNNFSRFVSFENLSIRPRNSGVVLMDSKDARHDITVDVVTYRYVPPANAVEP